jgi:lysyl-tRNA synthetase class 2
MASIEELRESRLKKLEALRLTGAAAYPSKSAKTHDLEVIEKDFVLLEGNKTDLTVAGRVMTSRGQGAIAFLDLYDGTARMQMVVKLPESSEETMNFLRDYVDVGDFIEVTGVAFTTKSGQHSILATQISMLSKALLPLPDKYHGLQDEELRMRERYLDILTNQELKDSFVKKAKFWKVVRNFFDAHGFLEVETPTIEVTTGGAEARPFKTHHNDFDLEVYMRICVGNYGRRDLWRLDSLVHTKLDEHIATKAHPQTICKSLLTVSFIWRTLITKKA